MANEGTDFRPTTSQAEPRDSNAAPPDYGTPPKPIAELVVRPHYPESIVGEHVDIGGYTGVVTAIVRNSIRVRSAEGTTQSFNCHTLRRIYGPRSEPEPPAPSSEKDVQPNKTSAPAAPPREVIDDPDFDQPITSIAALVTQPDFPKSAFGKHVDIAGYTGVVVEIINESLKVRSPQGTSRNYNAPVLRKIHGPQKA